MQTGQLAPGMVAS